jgi:hypothetical protein
MSFKCASVSLIKPYHVVPHRYNLLHVKVTREEAYDTIRHDLGEFYHDLPKVSDHRRVISHLEFRAHGHLI